MCTLVNMPAHVYITLFICVALVLDFSFSNQFIPPLNLSLSRWGESALHMSLFLIWNSSKKFKWNITLLVTGLRGIYKTNTKKTLSFKEKKTVSFTYVADSICVKMGVGVFPFCWRKINLEAVIKKSTKQRVYNYLKSLWTLLYVLCKCFHRQSYHFCLLYIVPEICCSKIKKKKNWKKY